VSSQILEELIQGVRLNRTQAHTFMAAILDEQVPNEIIAAAVAIMRSRSETTDEILGFRDAMMDRAIRLPIELPIIMDVCGTGGDRLGTFNVSTAVAIVLAACGVPVAKHGNRSVSSKCGSSDVLEAAGVPIHLDVDAHCRALETLNLALLHAPNHHPALKVLAPVRRSLGVMTVFNLMGPLVNPANLTHQLVGVPHTDSQDKFGAVYSQRKLPALIVRSENGADEALPGVAMRMVEVDASGARESGIHDPADWGVPSVPMEELAGGDPTRNAAALWNVLEGNGPTGLSAAAALGAGLALWKCGQEPDPATGYARASNVLATGEPARTLRAYIALMGGAP
jgi:anthranilate phosphoribosyltransferase